MAKRSHSETTNQERQSKPVERDTSRKKRRTVQPSILAEANGSISSVEGEGDAKKKSHKHIDKFAKLIKASDPHEGNLPRTADLSPRVVIPADKSLVAVIREVGVDTAAALESSTKSQSKKVDESVYDAFSNNSLCGAEASESVPKLRIGEAQSSFSQAAVHRYNLEDNTNNGCPAREQKTFGIGKEKAAEIAPTPAADRSGAQAVADPCSIIAQGLKTKKVENKKRKRTGSKEDTPMEPLPPPTVTLESDLKESTDAGSKLEFRPAKESKEAKKARKAQRKKSSVAEVIFDTKSSMLEKPKNRKASDGNPKDWTGAPNTRQAELAGITTKYVENACLTTLPATQIKSFLETHFVTVMDPLSAKYRPIIDFAYLPNHTESQQNLFTDFKAPTPIQAAAWPFLLAGRDAIGVAETGSGKTLAFGIPCLQYVRSFAQKKIGAGVKAIVISPTRELALQIYDQFVKIAAETSVKIVCLYGGVSKEEQRAALTTASVIVATPGRLKDFMQDGSADLGEVGYLVLDEADRMLDKGFEDDIRKIVAGIPTAQRQTVMFTATWPPSIRELAATFMENPGKIAIGDNPAGELRANTHIKQTVEVVDARGKEIRLLQLLKQNQSGKHSEDRILVFCLYKKEATRVENFLRSKGLKVAGIHGDMTQPQRTTSLEAFKSGRVPLLVATDVAARGLDIPAVKLVINVTFPLTVEDYVHRIGRSVSTAAKRDPY